MFIRIENKKNGARKMIDATTYTYEEFVRCCKAYSKNFDVKVIR